MKYYTFNQNNSGGSFIVDEKSGIDVIVVIEAATAEQANLIAKDKGIYFDGCDKNIDCNCCGDRWYPADESAGSSFPSIYVESVYDAHCEMYKKLAYIHLLDGTIKKVDFKPKQIKQ